MEKTRTIPVRLPVSLHKKFGKKLIDDGISAQEFLRKAIEDYVHRETEK